MVSHWCAFGRCGQEGVERGGLCLQGQEHKEVCAQCMHIHSAPVLHPNSSMSVCVSCCPALPHPPPPLPCRPSEITWHEKHWDNPDSRFLCWQLHDTSGDFGDVLIAFNAHGFEVRGVGGVGGERGEERGSSSREREREVCACSVWHGTAQLWHRGTRAWRLLAAWTLCGMCATLRHKPQRRVLVCCRPCCSHLPAAGALHAAQTPLRAQVVPHGGHQPGPAKGLHHRGQRGRGHHLRRGPTLSHRAARQADLIRACGGGGGEEFC